MRIAKIEKWVKVIVSSLCMLTRETNEENQRGNDIHERQELGYEKLGHKRGIHVPEPGPLAENGTDKTTTVIAHFLWKHVFIIT